ncbi:MAG: MFS transporter [Promethearchaeota archaeon]
MKGDAGLRPPTFDAKFRLAWGAASFGGSLISGIYAAMLPIFYQDYLGLSSDLITISSVIYAVWNAVNDPLFGFISDRTRTSKGRRIPYMRYTAPFLALTFALVWLAGPELGDATIFWWMLASTLLYDTAYTIIFLVYSALLPEITELDDERNKLQGVASLTSLLGTLVGFVVPDLVRPKAGDPSLLPFRLTMVGVGVAGSALIVFTTYRVRERPEFTVVDEPLGLRQALSLTFRSKSFLVLVSANFMNILLQALVLGYLFYVGDYVLRVGVELLLPAVFFPLVAGIFASQAVARRVGVVQAAQLFLVVGGVPLVLVPWLPTPALWAALPFAGLGFAGPLVLTNTLFAQVADEDELVSGVRREAAFFGVNALLTKPAQSVALALPAYVLDVTGFVTREENFGEIFLDQPATAIFGIKVIFGLIPGLAMLAGAAILLAYPLKGEVLARIKREVAALHVEKQSQLRALKWAGRDAACLVDAGWRRF